MEEQPKGHPHIISATIERMNAIFSSMGFEVTSGPEIESEHYNFDVINTPQDHPARDMQDTLWIKGRENIVARTQLSGIQVRYMEAHKPPLRIVYSGKVFRYEAIDATHEAQFYQYEILVVEKDASLANLKWVIENFFEKFFGKKVPIRLRPAFFPFVEPGVEVDMACFKCNRSGASCSVCKGTGWIEIIGAGMVHPQVLRNGGVDPKEWRGFAFAFGLDRLIMMRHEIDDIRLLNSGDLRFIHQF